jgi:hypothetical protein
MKLHGYDAIEQGVHVRGFMAAKVGPLLRHEIAVSEPATFIQPEEWQYRGPLIARSKDGRIVQQILRHVRKYGYAITLMPAPPTTFHVHDLQLDGGMLRLYSLSKDLTGFRNGLKTMQLGPSGDWWQGGTEKYLGTVEIRSKHAAEALGIKDYIGLVLSGVSAVVVKIEPKITQMERSMLREVNKKMKQYGVEVTDLRIDSIKISKGQDVTPAKSHSADFGVQQTTDGSYEVALSFAGEQRDYVEQVAVQLRSNNIRVFYDKFETIELWGKDGLEYFEEMFAQRAGAVVIFISKEYVQKSWTRHERRSAFSRAILEHKEYVLPVRFDDTPVPGLPSTIQYLSARDFTPEQLARAICHKLAYQKSS